MTESTTRLAQLFAREKTRFLRFIRRRLLDAGWMDADDILSEVTYNVLRRGDVVGEVETLSAYVYRCLPTASRITSRSAGRRSWPSTRVTPTNPQTPPCRPTPARRPTNNFSRPNCRGGWPAPSTR